MKTILIVIGAAVLLIVGGGWWSQGIQNKEIKGSTASDNLISEKGIHWHPKLMITMKGEKQTIPANIGMGMQYAGYTQYDSMMMMTNMHTHDSSGMIHWEVMQGPVKREDVRLANFFSVWGKKFTNSCILEKCDGPDGQLKFVVNGKDNLDFENYLVNDKDEIEIRYE